MFYEESLSKSSPDFIFATKTSTDGVYSYQLEQLKRLRGEQSSSFSADAWTAKNTKSFRGVRQRQWGKWVAEIRLPQKRTRVWLGTYDSPEVAACAYDIAASKLRGEYTRLNFPQLQDITGASALRSSVDAKIQAVYRRLNRKRQSMKKSEKGSSRYAIEEIRRKMETEEWEIEGPERSSTRAIEPSYSSSSSNKSTMTWNELTGDVEEECSLETMPAFDQDLIWQILAN